MPALAMFRQSVVFLSSQRPIRSLVTKRRVFRPLVRRFVAGEQLNEAIEATEALNAAGLKVTLDHLGESVASEAEAFRAASDYLTMLAAIAEQRLDANVSLKLSHMGLKIGSDLAYGNLRRVADRARELGVFVRVDMESHHWTDATLAIVERIRADLFSDVGVVVQSCLRRSTADVSQLNAQGTRVRLCKGAYLEPSQVAFAKKEDVDTSFASLAEQLLDTGVYPAFATHDPKLIQHVRTVAERRGVDKQSFEFQMLYGIRRDLQLSLAEQGHNVRVYVPFGVAWYPYLTRRLAERPANLLFFMRAALRN